MSSGCILVQPLVLEELTHKSSFQIHDHSSIDPSKGLVSPGYDKGGSHCQLVLFNTQLDHSGAGA